jgi:hypothetical protein
LFGGRCDAKMIIQPMPTEETELEPGEQPEAVADAASLDAGAHSLSSLKRERDDGSEAVAGLAEVAAQGGKAVKEGDGV